MIDEKNLIEEIKSLQVTVNGLRAGKGILREFEKQYRESILRIIEEQQKVGEWIPCSERLPEAEQEVLLQLEDNMIVGFYLVEGGHFDGTTNWYGLGDNDIYTDCDSKPIAWMPLPDPYKPDSVDTEKPEWKDRMMQTFLGGRR